jgi:hypothetical protein
MDTEPGHHESQWEALSQRLFYRTFWGDYAGDIVSRFYYTEVLKMAPLAVGSIEAMHGQGLVLIGVEPDNEEYRDQLREVIRFLAYFDPESREYGHGELWDSEGLSNFEFEAANAEMMTGWWGEYAHRELVDHFEDWEGNTIVPELGSEGWSDLLWRLLYEDGEYYPYWEGADSLIVPGWETEKAVEWLLDEYARSITEAGNPQPIAI